MPSRYEGFLKRPYERHLAGKTASAGVAFITADAAGEATERFLALRAGKPCEILHVENVGEKALVEDLLRKLFYVLFPYDRNILVHPAAQDAVRRSPFRLEKVNEGLYLKNPLHGKKRLVRIGTLPTGPLNRISDIEGIEVGHATIDDGSLRTGVTAVHPHGGNPFSEKCEAAQAVFNGFGKSMGLLQLEETGTLETPVLFTNTLSAGTVFSAVVDHMVEKDPRIGRKRPTVNPLVLECNDGSLSDIQARAVEARHVRDALRTAEREFPQGSVGAGAGMTTHGHKGGIGSSSRLVEVGEKTYTLGVLLNANFHGDTPRHLVFKGRAIGKDIADGEETKEDQGSITILVATDAPLCSRQLKRIAKRSFFGIARTGSIVSGGSGDLAVAFSTANRRDHYEKAPVHDFQRLAERQLDGFFQAVIEATEEAILAGMLHSPAVEGFQGKKKRSFFERIDLFENLLVPWDE